MTTVWEPDDRIRHGRLSKPELRWLAGKAQETPAKSPERDEKTVSERQPDKEQDRG